jgi:hypothetical protein
VVMKTDAIKEALAWRPGKTLARWPKNYVAASAGWHPIAPASWASGQYLEDAGGAANQCADLPRPVIGVVHVEDNPTAPSPGEEPT